MVSATACPLKKFLQKFELGPEAASALRRFNRAIERQGHESRFCGNEGDVIDVGPDGMNR